MFENTKHLLSGAAKYATAKLLLSPTETSAARVAVCNDCELLSDTRQCGVCQCFVDQKAKYTDEHCPIAIARAITGDYASETDTISAMDKWGQELGLTVPRGFLISGDLIALPRVNRIVNLRTKQSTELGAAARVAQQT